MSWLRGNSTAPIGIDLEGRSLRAVQMNPSARGSEVKAAVSVRKSTADASIDAKDVERLVRLLPNRGFVGVDVVLAVPSSQLLTGILELPPRRSGAPVDKIAASELSRMHKTNAAALEMASWPLPVPERVADTEPVMVAACSYSDSNSLLDMFESFGCSVRALDIRPCAIARACEPLLDTAPAMTAVLEIGWHESQLVGLRGSTVIYQRSLDDSGLEHLGKKLAGRPLTDLDAAQQLIDSVKLDDSNPGGDIQAKALWHFDGIIGELETPLSYMQNQYREGALTGMLLIGPGASITGLQSHLAARLELETRVVSPVDVAACTGQLVDECGSALTVALGLAKYPEG